MGRMVNNIKPMLRSQATAKPLVPGAPSQNPTMTSEQLVAIGEA